MYKYKCIKYGKEFEHSCPPLTISLKIDSKEIKPIEEGSLCTDCYTQEAIKYKKYTHYETEPIITIKKEHNSFIIWCCVFLVILIIIFLLFTLLR